MKLSYKRYFFTRARIYARIKNCVKGRIQNVSKKDFLPTSCLLPLTSSLLPLASYLLPLTSSLLLLTSCSTIDDREQTEHEGDPVAVDLAFTVTESHKSSRMTAAVVQEQGQAYRGITVRQIVPFAVTGKITVDDNPKRELIISNGEKPVEGRPYYYYSECSFMQGVNAFLSYGRATITSENKAVNGSLVETFPLAMTPKDIRFSLESISTQEAHATATSLANYMTTIANAQGNSVAWKNAPSAVLKLVYQNFINQTGSTSDGEMLPGSATNVKKYAQALKSVLQPMTLTGDDDAIRTAIITAIDSYNTAWDGFPASIGLPDGAAVIHWNAANNRFEPQLTHTELADINGIDRFAYPSELYYYGNSRINTSNIDDRKSVYTDTDWSNVLAQYEYPNSEVRRSTKAVAIIDPLQYGVAHLQIILKKTNSSELLDAKGTSVSVGSNYFPLTGIIVGGQIPVGFDFSPNTAYPVYSEADAKFIYDSQVKTNGTSENEFFYLSATTDATKATNTLVLQSYDHKKVPVVLEFINNSDKDFVGIDGIVYQGTKFYLVGEVDPDEASSDPRTEIRDRVFTQDYTTTLNMKVTSLEKAYNVVPNLLSPRLEMGIEVLLKWASTTPEEIVL